MHDDNRGVSDVIGFVIVAGLLLASVALVSTTAFTQLNDARDAQQRENVVRAYTVLNSNIGDIVAEEASRRTTEIKTGGGQIGLGPSRTIEITDSSGNTITSESYRPIVYAGPSGDRVLYSNGAIIRELPSGSTMAEEPAWYATTQGSSSDTTVYLSVVRTDVSTGPLSIGGSGTVAISATEQGSSVSSGPVTTSSAADTIRISSTSSPDAWARYCDSEPYLNTESTTSSSVTCDIDENGMVVVEQTDIQVFLD